MVWMVAFLISMFCPMPNRGDYVCVRFGYELLIHYGEGDRVIGAHWVDWEDGTQPGFYWLVTENNEPPYRDTLVNGEWWKYNGLSWIDNNELPYPYYMWFTEGLNNQRFLQSLNSK